ncbi:hypothetical protein AWB77_04821 [Caballeronia fortuita]|uniref:Uncharacterized protein n=1 Tax=Caballeronia fortuita TaxID=1777138 RepID=A0A158D2B3_9BURK|nr:hypothetical protein [Caballeronia fortuita]SAK88795.1 hypothetical protein AWB77_04821 [Caballeronia fortuita]
MSKPHPLKAVSLIDLEGALAKTIGELTGRRVTVDVNEFITDPDATWMNTATSSIAMTVSFPGPSSDLLNLLEGKSDDAS